MKEDGGELLDEGGLEAEDVEEGDGVNGGRGPRRGLGRIGKEARTLSASLHVAPRPLSSYSLPSLFPRAFVRPSAWPATDQSRLDRQPGRNPSLVIPGTPRPGAETKARKQTQARHSLVEIPRSQSLVVESLLAVVVRVDAHS